LRQGRGVWPDVCLLSGNLGRIFQKLIRARAFSNRSVFSDIGIVFCHPYRTLFFGLVRAVCSVDGGGNRHERGAARCAGIEI
jgi:hypothetical protein